MKNEKSSKLFGYSIKMLIIFLVFFGYSTLFAMITCENINLNDEFNKGNIKHSTNLEVDPIAIDGDGAHNWAWVQTQSWFGGGDGSEGNPYIIENIIIDGGNLDNCIEIKNSDVYFILRNSQLYNASRGFDKAGIFLYMTNNGNITNVNCSNNNNIGIWVEQSNNIAILDNIINNNGGPGIHLYHCDYIDVIGNEVSNNIIGIRLWDCDNCNVMENIMKDNSNSGIMLRDSDYNIISGNTANDNLFGIYLKNSNSNKVNDNTFLDNLGDSIQEDEDCEGNTIENNNCGDSSAIVIPGFDLIIILSTIIAISSIKIKILLKNRKDKKK
ncbi:MAG: right-handed parallel beta-helix repeat-containing protein [Candidatus Lokiarchaeota archaeon]|nr:right-handed parallel beta-helix repeat-containing protein [Candidatus Lokiarchaeota archaeon]